MGVASQAWNGFGALVLDMPVFTKWPPLDCFAYENIIAL